MGRIPWDQPVLPVLPDPFSFSSGILAVRLTWDDLERPKSEEILVSGSPLKFLSPGYLA